MVRSAHSQIHLVLVHYEKTQWLFCVPKHTQVFPAGGNAKKKKKNDEDEDDSLEQSKEKSEEESINDAFVHSVRNKLGGGHGPRPLPHPTPPSY